MTSAASAVHVAFRLTSSLGDNDVRAAVEQLSAEERARYERFVMAPDRRDFAAAHALLRQSLSVHGDRAPHEWAFQSNPHGKPYLSSDTQSGGLSFNLTHTDGLVACIVAHDLMVGIDAEATDRRVDVPSLVRTVFSPREIRALESCPGSERLTRFLETWTLKEAYVKAIGEGLSCPLQELTFLVEDETCVRFELNQSAPDALWQFAIFAPSSRHRMAVAVGGFDGSRVQILVTQVGSVSGG